MTSNASQKWKYSTLAFAALLGLALLPAAVGTNNRPGPQEIWNAIDSLQEQIDNIGRSNNPMQVIFFTTGATTLQDDNEVHFMGLASAVGGEESNYILFPVGGTIDDMRAFHPTPTALSDMMYTVRLNSADTILSCEIQPAQQTCTSTGPVSVSAGDRVSIKIEELHPTLGDPVIAPSVSVVFNPS